MALRIQPRRWQGLLLAAVGAAPFTACGAATELEVGGSGGEAQGGGAGGTRNAQAGSKSTGGKANPGGGGKADPGGGGKAAGGRPGVGGTGFGGTPSVGGKAGVGGQGQAGGPPGVNRFPCQSPTPFPLPGMGYELCSNGAVHRVGPASCLLGGECANDSHCSAGTICVCDGAGYGQCETAYCSADSQCGPGFQCIGDRHWACTAEGSEFRCQRAGDLCASSLTCGSCSACIVGESGRLCAEPCCASGRPFLVGGVARVAGVVERDDWLERGLAPGLSGLTLAQRARLAEAWQQSAQLEHASIAAFSRFVLDAMSLGAPAELIEGATRAMLDEAAHARACFALASGYGAAALGPSSLLTSSSLEHRTLEAIVESAVLEGCIGETLAALEAAEALEHATDPAVRCALERIARDELEHAALAYRFVDWATRAFGPELRRVVERAFREGLRSLPRAGGGADAPSADAPGDAALLAHGILPSAHRLELASSVVRELLEPLATELRAA